MTPHRAALRLQVLRLGAWLLGPQGRELAPDAWERCYAAYRALYERLETT